MSWSKGRPMPEETKKKISESSKGKKHSEETKNRMSVAHKGKKFSKEHCEKIRERMTGNTPWNKGRKGVYSEETIEKLKQAGRQKTFTQEHRQNISKANKGRDGCFKGHKHTNAAKNKMSIAGKKVWAARDIHERRDYLENAWLARTANPSSIEIAICKELGLLNITHQIGKRISPYFPDIFIPCCNLVIECDGDYWHNYPDGRESDRKRDAYMKDKGYKVIRLWERDIRKNARQALLEGMKIINA